jgi:hypothetical protein
VKHRFLRCCPCLSCVYRRAALQMTREHTHTHASTCEGEGRDETTSTSREANQMRCREDKKGEGRRFSLACIQNKKEITHNTTRDASRKRVANDIELH